MEQFRSQTLCVFSLLTKIINHIVLTIHEKNVISFVIFEVFVRFNGISCPQDKRVLILL